MNTNEPLGRDEWSDRISDIVDPSNDTPSVVDITALDERSRRDLGDQLFVDAILGESARATGDEVQSRLSTVLREIDQMPTVGEKHQPLAHRRAISTARRWLVSSFSLALGVALGAMIILMPVPSAPTAEAAVERAIRHADRPVDRHYAVRVQLRNVPPINADLYLRGPRQLALHANGPLGFSLWLGSSGEQGWMVPEIGPVVIANDFELVQDRLEELAGLPLPLLRITHVLRSLNENYSVKIMPAVKTNPESGRLLSIVATKRAGFRPILPTRIEFQLDFKSGSVDRLSLDWTGSIENIAVRQITFQLKDEQAQDVSWYHPSSHYADDRPILELDPNQKSKDR